MTKIKDLFTVDLRSLALFRIALGLLILAQLADRAFVLQPLYTDQGLFPRILAIQLSGLWHWSLYFMNGTVELTVIFFLLAASSAVLLVLGYHTRMVAFFSYLFVVSLQNRNAMIPNGGDYLLRLLVFWSLFLPLGRRFSLDNRFNPLPKEIPDRAASVATAAFLLQAAFIYFFSALSKMGSGAWQSGEAVYDALALGGYTRPLAAVIRHTFPPIFFKSMTYATMGIELGGSVLLFSPFFTGTIRLIVISLLALIQLGFCLCLEVNLFPWAAIAATLPFLPTRLWTRKMTPPVFLKASWVNQILTGLFLVYITLSNVEGLTYKSPFYRSIFPRFIIPSGFRWIGNLLALDQSWDMFIPPGKISYWFVGVGKLKDGTSVDILREGAPIQWERPKRFFKNEPWRAYLMNLGGRYKDAMAPYVGPYFCREWNQGRPADKQLQELEVFIMSQENLPASQQPTRYYKSLLTYVCKP